jgi:hypothetical protein
MIRPGGEIDSNQTCSAFHVVPLSVDTKAPDLKHTQRSDRQ